MKTYRIGVASKDTGKMVVHKVMAESDIAVNTGGYNELRLSVGDQVVARFNGWAWCKVTYEAS